MHGPMALPGKDWREREGLVPEGPSVLSVEKERKGLVPEGPVVCEEGPTFCPPLIIKWLPFSRV